MNKTIFILRAKNSDFIATCYFTSVRDAMVFAHEIGLEFGKYEILELTRF